MAISELAPRILNLPDDIRAALARVDGPGWLISNGHHPKPIVVTAHGAFADMEPLLPGLVGRGDWAWWSGNPAAAVAAVLCPPGSPLHAYSLYYAHGLLRGRLVGHNDDHAAALTIIEGYVAGRGPS